MKSKAIKKPHGVFTTYYPGNVSRPSPRVNGSTRGSVVRAASSSPTSARCVGVWARGGDHNYLAADVGAGARQEAEALVDRGDVEPQGPEACLQPGQSAPKVADSPVDPGHVPPQQGDLRAEPRPLRELLARVPRPQDLGELRLEFRDRTPEPAQTQPLVFGLVAGARGRGSGSVVPQARHLLPESTRMGWLRVSFISSFFINPRLIFSLSRV
jgi:hypothetical protein